MFTPGLRGPRLDCLHRGSWTFAIAMLGMVGAWVALLSVSGPELICAAMTNGAVAVAVSVHVLPRFGLPGSGLLAWSSAGSLAAALCVASIGWFVLIQDLMLVLAVIVALTHPRTIALIARTGERLDLRRVFERAAVPVAGRTLSPDVFRLSEVDLCRSWRISYWALERALREPDLQAALCLIEFRQSSLDEMERRHRSGFRRWLQEQPGPAGDPIRYITGPPADQLPTPPAVAIRPETPDRPT